MILIKMLVPILAVVQNPPVVDEQVAVAEESGEIYEMDFSEEEEGLIALEEEAEESDNSL